MNGQVIEFVIVSHEQLGKTRSKKLRQHEHRKAHNPRYRESVAQQAALFLTVLCTVLITHKRRRAHAITLQHRTENHASVHDYAVRGNAIFAQICHKLEVVEHSDNARSNNRHHFRRTIDAHLAQKAPISARPSQTKEAAVRTQEIDQRNNTA